jgi:hypothetical protein
MRVSSDEPKELRGALPPSANQAADDPSSDAGRRFALRWERSRVVHPGIGSDPSGNLGVGHCIKQGVLWSEDVVDVVLLVTSVERL